MQRTTHKRLLSVLLAIVMVVALVPLTAFAAPATAVILGHASLGFSATLDADNPYLVNGNSSPDDPEDVHTAHFDASNGTLTLRGYDGGSINSNGDIHIILEGENNVTVTNKLTAINSGDNILISGSGTLSIDLNYSPGSGHVNGIYASNGNITIISGTVSIGVTTDDEGCGIRAADSITIGGVVNVDVTNTGNNKSYGLRANDDIIIESGELTVTAESTGTESAGDNIYGIYANGTHSLIANKGGIVEVNVKTGSAGGHSYGIYAYGSSSAIAIEGGKTTLKAESAKEHSFGLYSFASDITVTDGEITLEVESAEKNSYGIYTNGTDENITISGGEITLNTKSTQGNSYGISAGNGSNVIIEDGVVDIDVDAGGASGEGIGIRAFNVGDDKGDVTISGGTVEISATADNSSRGISAAGTITISTDEMLKIATNGQAINKEPIITLANYNITPAGAVFSDSNITYTYDSGSATYTVTFNANEGSGTMSPQTFTDGVAQALTANAFTRADYTFEGWATSSGGSVVYTDGQNVTIASNITLYAVWADVTPPSLSGGGVSRTSDTAATIGFSTNEAGMAYCLVLASGDSAPSNTAIKAGTALGAVTAGSNTGKAVTLTAGAKDIYVVVEDTAGNLSAPLKIMVSAYNPGGGGTPSNPSGSFYNNLSTFEADSGVDLVYIAQKGFSLFKEVKVDGTVLVRNTDYRAESSSTRITLFAGYLDTLSVGTHTLAVGFTDGTSATAGFTVKEKSSPVPMGNPFSDVYGTDWFVNDVLYVYENGLMNGTNTSPMLFSPRDNLTRGMIVTILYRLENEPNAGGLDNPFDDVAAGMYYADAVKWAAANEIVTGYGNDRFGPEDSITRQDLAVILMRYMVFKENNIAVTQQDIVFADEADIAAYAMDAIRALNRLGIINGTGTNDAGQIIISPKGNATRAEAAAMLHRFLEAIA